MPLYLKVYRKIINDINIAPLEVRQVLVYTHFLNHTAITGLLIANTEPILANQNFIEEMIIVIIDSTYSKGIH